MPPERCQQIRDLLPPRHAPRRLQPERAQPPAHFGGRNHTCAIALPRPLEPAAKWQGAGVSCPVSGALPRRDGSKVINHPHVAIECKRPEGQVFSVRGRDGTTNPLGVTIAQ